MKKIESFLAKSSRNVLIHKRLSCLGQNVTVWLYAIQNVSRLQCESEATQSYWRVRRLSNFASQWKSPNARSRYQDIICKLQHTKWKMQVLDWYLLFCIVWLSVRICPCVNIFISNLLWVVTFIFWIYKKKKKKKKKKRCKKKRSRFISSAKRSSHWDWLSLIYILYGIYRISSNKRPGAYKIFSKIAWALIGGGGAY